MLVACVLIKNLDYSPIIFNEKISLSLNLEGKSSYFKKELTILK
jgi:hypothetical protein